MQTTDRLAIMAFFVVTLFILNLTHNKTKTLEAQLEQIETQQKIQAELDTSIKEAVFELRNKEAVTTREVHYATREIERLPNAKQPVPDDVAASWRAGIERVRASRTDNQPGNR